MSAYNRCYLLDAKQNLASCFDYAINDCKLNSDTFAFMFINSNYSKLFETGNPRIISGISGVELARLVITESIDSITFVENTFKENKSKEYWAGYFLAEYRYEVGRSFKDIFYRISLSEIIDMYNPYHEMDIKQFINSLEKRIIQKNIDAKLKTIRQKVGLSQSELAKKSGVNLRSIQMYEQKQNDIDKAQAKTLYALANVLNCNIEDLLENVTY